MRELRHLSIWLGLIFTCCKKVKAKANSFHD